jgi:hypothetical protein
MSDSELAVVVAPQTFPTPILIDRAGPSTRKKFFEFFTVPIRNANTRAAYYRAIQQFLAWAERAGYQDGAVRYVSSRMGQATSQASLARLLPGQASAIFTSPRLIASASIAVSNSARSFTGSLVFK